MLSLGPKNEWIFLKIPFWNEFPFSKDGNSPKSHSSMGFHVGKMVNHPKRMACHFKLKKLMENGKSFDENESPF
jgi:hypothetical protein